MGDSVHEFDLELPDAVIAQEIVRLPDGFDFSKTNLLQILLLSKKPEERDPQRYAEIFQIASMNPSVSLWMKYACRAEVINATRRMKGIDMISIIENLGCLFDEAEKELPKEKNSYILLGDILYSRGIARRGPRQYTDAARDQLEAAQLFDTAGNKEKMYISLFVALVEKATAHFVVRNKDGIWKSVKEMISMRAYIQHAVDPFPAWMEYNAHIHIRWAVAMARLIGVEIVYSDLDSDSKHWKEKSPAQWAKVAHAAEQYFAGKFSELAKQDPINIQSSSADNAGLSVKIFVALANRMLGLNSKGDLQIKYNREANDILKDVANHAGLDGGIPIAVAKHLLS
ncbi:MAG: hypothetical protein HY445_02065 [Candidatus Niyogibacteria bacterium]|nr:hypothetical protein [Candidatus Niyogibacteria bacterium]